MDPRLAMGAFGLEGDNLVGSFSGEGGFSGTMEDYRLDFSGSSSNGVLWGQPYDRLDATLRLDRKGLRLQDVEMRKARSLIHMAGTIGRDGMYCLDFQDSDIYLEDLSLVPPGWTGKVTLDADCVQVRRKGKGSVEGAGRVTISDFAYRSAALGSGDLNLSLVNDRLQFKGMVMDDRCRVAGWTFLSDWDLWSVEADCGKADYSAFVLSALKDRAPEDFKLALGGRLEAHSVAGRASYGGRVEELSVSAYGRTFHLAEPVDLSLRKNRYNFTVP